MTIRSRIAPPFYQGAHPRMTQATNPWRLLSLGCRPAPNRTRAASRKWKWPTHCDLHTRCAHALARRRGSRLAKQVCVFARASAYEGVLSFAGLGSRFRGNERKKAEPLTAGPKHRLIRPAICRYSRYCVGSHPSGCERIECDQRVGVLNPGQCLNLVRNKPPDILLGFQIELAEQIVVARRRIKLGHLLDRIGCGLGDLVGPPHFAFDLNEDRAHRSPPFPATCHAR